MTTKEFLLDQFTSCYDVNGWFVALENTLNNLTAEQAAWKPDGADNSIWGILSHLNFYNERYLKKFKNEPVGKIEMENSETFAAAENASEDDWKREIERFNALMSGWRNALESADESKFGQAVSAENQSTWAEVVGLINTHNSHHGGQIVILRKLQKSWDAAKGVS
jgi:uncharacterized damage-inducible protein DinB